MPNAMSKTFTKTRNYNLAKNKFGYVSDLVSVVMSLAMLQYAPMLWSLAAEAVGAVGLDAGNQYCHAMSFVVLSSVAEYPISTVLKVYSTFVIEQEFGFNKHTWKTFVSDEIKS